MVELRRMIEADFEILYQFGMDQESSLMAKVHPRPRDDFYQFWTRVIKDQKTFANTVLFDGQVVGMINAFAVDEEKHVGYWIGREYWGKGIGKSCLVQFLELYKERPLYAVVANTNLGSNKILNHCGFEKIDEYLSEESDRYMACTVSKLVLR